MSAILGVGRLLYDGSRDVIELCVETGDPSAQPVVEAKVLENLRHNFADFWKNREMRLYDLRVVTCPPQ
ncbi:MAG: hypothetical protein QOC61_176 [Acidobacteriota bacterium]|nr:hypothetical protein [Acidobacteriota bacterium]MDT5261172.1 hypothetical protein [Acidobacteriota bacterium]